MKKSLSFKREDEQNRDALSIERRRSSITRNLRKSQFASKEFIIPKEKSDLGGDKIILSDSDEMKDKLSSSYSASDGG